MKGYTYQQETPRQVGLEAMKNGLGGGDGVGGGLSDLASLGITLGAMGGVIGMTKDAVAPVLVTSAQIGQGLSQVATDKGWDCSCGPKNISTNFCPNCDTKKPQQENSWDCVQCGLKGITTNFCPNCGEKGQRLTSGIVLSVVIGRGNHE